MAAAVIVGTAAAYVEIILWQRAGRNFPNFDHYTYFYPNLFYTLRALQQGWGLLWNPYQNCGQPNFAISGVGALYPLHWVSLLVGLDAGQFVEAGLHLVVAGLGAYWLGRELRLGAPAALSAAVAFELSGCTLHLLQWVPQNVGAYVWMPAIVAASERALRRPSGRAAILLGLLSAVQILPGYPQINVFTYQVVALRALWVVAIERPARPLHGLAAVLSGLALGPLLAAVQLIPSLELAHQSVRSRGLSLEEMRSPAFTLTWARFRHGLAVRNVGAMIVPAVGMALAGAAVTGKRTRRTALFFLALAVLYGMLAFDTPVFDLYRRLPLGSMFRLPHRALWVAGFAGSMLVGFGVEAVLAARAGPPLRRLLSIAAAAAGVLVFATVSPNGLTGEEAALLAMTAAVVAVTVLVPRGHLLGVLGLPLLMLLASFSAGKPPFLGPPPSAGFLFQRRAAFDWLKTHMTPQERMYQFAVPRGFAVIPKSASLFAIPSITDYETQTAERFAELHVWLLTNHRMLSINDFYFKMSVTPSNRPLLNLLGARYVVVDGPAAPVAPSAGPPLALIRTIGRTRIYENRAALPRAFFVPRLAVAASPAEVVDRLASPDNDPRAVVWVDVPPPDGFLGVPLASAAGSHVTIDEDRGERLVLSVDAPSEGFLFLADQYYPGWEATVNGAPATILRANHDFRAVRVPRGRSVVRFRYRPASLRIGALVSAVSAAGVAIFLLGDGRARRRRLAAADAATEEGQAE